MFIKEALHRAEGGIREPTADGETSEISNIKKPLSLLDMKGQIEGTVLPKLKRANPV